MFWLTTFATKAPASFSTNASSQWSNALSLWISSGWRSKRTTSWALITLTWFGSEDPWCEKQAASHRKTLDMRSSHQLLHTRRPSTWEALISSDQETLCVDMGDLRWWLAPSPLQHLIKSTRRGWRRICHHQTLLIQMMIAREQARLWLVVEEEEALNGWQSRNRSPSRHWKAHVWGRHAVAVDSGKRHAIHSHCMFVEWVIALIVKTLPMAGEVSAT